MSFENACKGIRKIRTAEFMSLASEILVSMAAEGAESAKTTSALTAVTGIAGILLSAAAAILILLGVKDASGDDKSFQRGYIAAIIAAAVNIIGAIVSMTGIVDSGNVILSSVINLVNVAVSFFVIQGIINISVKSGNMTMAENGMKVFGIYAFALIVSSVVEILTAAGSAPKPLIMMFTAAVMIAAIIGYIMYLHYLSQAVRILSEEN